MLCPFWQRLRKCSLVDSHFCVNKWMVVSIPTEPEFKAGTPQVVFEGPYVNVSGLSYDVAPDGQRFLVLQPQYDDSQIKAGAYPGTIRDSPTV